MRTVEAPPRPAEVPPSAPERPRAPQPGRGALPPARVAELAARVGWARLGVALLLAAAVAFNLYHLWPEVALGAPPLNDDVLHRAAARSAAAALTEGRDPTDTWLPAVTEG